MSEREPQDIAKIGTWVVERLANRIGQELQPTSAPDFGNDLAYIVPTPSDEPPRSIDRVLRARASRDSGHTVKAGRRTGIEPATGEKAEKICQDSPTRGERVRVTGCVQQREQSNESERR